MVATGLQLGSVVFEDDNSTAIICLADSSPHDLAPIATVLWGLDHAFGILQHMGGCCDSFTFLANRGCQVELERINMGLLPGLAPLFSQMGLEEQSMDSLPPDLLAQFFSLAFLSYSQGHCGPIRPFFLDTFPGRILLIGNNKWCEDFEGPLFTFQFLDRAPSLSKDRPKLDLRASPEDLLDTWGPGDFIAPKGDAENIYAISIGGGLILPTSKPTEASEALLHWSRASTLDTRSGTTFPCRKKLIIGANVSTNTSCDAEP
ncbi:hypothetical protein B0H67DRAFT_649029 [Lasiosphaeris hirsuta]|uniref:Uncharacterized protein n=1 Tax=Lasiosphaeris hirsuta TaxID=260670 RepID=A0AA40DIN4_9PEZI|nr:hypothetical protein B0H67DRAFT_649029 [Lasiosphaeris hirsuta]